MNIKNIFTNDRDQSIESLQFFFFLNEVYFSLLKLKHENNENNQIQEFIDIIGKNYYYQSYKIKNYIISLNDYIFWQSRQAYIENMQKFIDEDCSTLDFAYRVYFLIKNNKKESESLVKDFKKQLTLELNPRIFQFSKIIGDLELVLEGFIPESTTDLTEDELKIIIKNVLIKIQNDFK